MVSLLSLFAPLEVITHRLARLPCGAVDALQHRVRFTAAPVCTGGRQQLECPDLARGLDMPAAAQVLKRAIGVAAKRDALPIGNAVQNLQLVGIVRHEFTRCVALNLSLYECSVGTNGGAHLFLYLCQVIWSEGLWHVEVVVEAIADRRADG